MRCRWRSRLPSLGTANLSLPADIAAPSALTLTAYRGLPLGEVRRSPCASQGSRLHYPALCVVLRPALHVCRIFLIAISERNGGLKAMETVLATIEETRRLRSRRRVGVLCSPCSAQVQRAVSCAHSFVSRC